tara:strand:- start:461 stop:766 length:306 start_codon:yes stop_codon:yes gene_type:complete
MSAKTPFEGVKGTNQAITSSGTSQSVTLPLGSESVRVVNTGATNFCYVAIGTGTVTATSGDSPVLPGESIVFHKGSYDDTVSVIQNTGAELILIQPGSGGI